MSLSRWEFNPVRHKDEWGWKIFNNTFLPPTSLTFILGKEQAACMQTGFDLYCRPATGKKEKLLVRLMETDGQSTLKEQFKQQHVRGSSTGQDIKV